MILRILKDKDLPKEPSKQVEAVTPELRTFAAFMMGTMTYNKGVGLAAPQVGENIRLIVFDCINITMNAMDSGFMFNPEIIETGEESTIAQEGCLSFPKQFVEVKRDRTIKVKYLDIAGRWMVRSYSGLAARIIQHEIDHLDGITMLDRAKETK